MQQVATGSVVSHDFRVSRLKSRAGDDFLEHLKCFVSTD